MTERLENIRRMEREVIEALAILNRTSMETKHGEGVNKGPANSGDNSNKQDDGEIHSNIPPLKRGRLDRNATFKRVERVHAQLKPTTTTSHRSANKKTPARSSGSPPRKVATNEMKQVSYGDGGEKYRYWMPNLQINKKVIVQKIQYYLGHESTVRPYARDVTSYHRLPFILCPTNQSSRAKTDFLLQHQENV